MPNDSIGYSAEPGFTHHMGDGCWGRIEAHHYNYDRPLEVTWLCVGHHRKVHND
jgi:hypothetical protein